MNNRLFCSGNRKCKNGCIYCFSTWQEERVFSLFDRVSLDGFSILYPICDSEVLYQDDSFWNNFLNRLDAVAGPVVVSLSTKCDWDDNKLLDIVNFNKNHSTKIKLAISFTAMDNLDLIEPNALSFEKRIELLAKIKRLGIPTNVLLKPILPFVAYDEYVRLIQICSKICDCFVVGGLYVDRQSDFFHKHIKDKFPISLRYSTWLKKEADYVEHPQYHEIKAYINGLGCQVFEMDSKFIETTMFRNGEEL